MRDHATSSLHIKRYVISGVAPTFQQAYLLLCYIKYSI